MRRQRSANQPIRVIRFGTEASVMAGATLHQPSAPRSLGAGQCGFDDPRPTRPATSGPIDRSGSPNRPPSDPPVEQSE